MLNSIRYYRRLYRRSGIAAVWFLLQSKFQKRKKEGVRVGNMAHAVSLSNFQYDVTTLFQIFLKKEYDIRELNDASYVIDCGANIGLSAVFFANKYPNAKIIAIEPDEQNFSFLKKNTSPYPNVTCLQRAIWSSSENLQVIDPGNGGWSLQTRVSEEGSLKGITIDEIMDEYDFPRIDLLKIDIEGAEKELFAHSFESWLSKTRVIAIELHDFIEPGTSKSFFAAIQPYKFRTYSQGENLICIKDEQPG